MTRDLVGVLVIAALGAWGGWELCTNYGAAARKLAKWNAEIAATNNRLQQFEADEGRKRIADEDRARSEDTAFAKDLPRLKQCILDEAQANALNRIGVEP